MSNKILIIIALCWIAQLSQAQPPTVNIEADTAKTEKKKERKPVMGGLFQEPKGMNPSPKKAFLLSLALPGAGQIYNKKNALIWAPFWMGVAGTGIYGIVYYRGQYIEYRDIYRDEVAGIPHILTGVQGATPAAIKNYRDLMRQRSEQAIFGTIGIYLLNGVQAFTAAHLLNFDIDDDLSLRLEPSIQQLPMSTAPTLGMGLTFSF